MPGTEVPLGSVAIFELRHRDGPHFCHFGIRMGPGGGGGGGHFHSKVIGMLVVSFRV